MCIYIVLYPYLSPYISICIYMSVCIYIYIILYIHNIYIHIQDICVHMSHHICYMICTYIYIYYIRTLYPINGHTGIFTCRGFIQVCICTYSDIQLCINIIYIYWISVHIYIYIYMCVLVLSIPIQWEAPAIFFQLRFHIKCIHQWIKRSSDVSGPEFAWACPGAAASNA